MTDKVNQFLYSLTPYAESIGYALVLFVFLIMSF